MKPRLSMIAVAAAMLPLACTAVPAIQGSAQGASNPTEDREIWVTLQATDRIAILHGARGQGARETIELPAGTGPHITTFSLDGKYAYVSGMGNGALDIVSVDTRQVVQALHLGPAATHQAKTSPDGSSLLVAQVASKSLIKVRASEAGQTWTPEASLSFAAAGKAPICTIFRDDGQKAFVSLNPSGLAIVDVATMTIDATLPTNGFIACGMVKSEDGRTVTLAANGGGGHVYRLDTATGALADLGTIGAVDWHSFNMSPDGKIGFGTVPRGDELRIIDLTTNPVSTIAALRLDPTPGAANDQPDNMGVAGDFVYVSLRASGKLAIVNYRQQTVSYIDLAPAATSINPANCLGCALHGVAVHS